MHSAETSNVLLTGMNPKTVVRPIVEFDLVTKQFSKHFKTRKPRNYVSGNVWSKFSLFIPYIFIDNLKRFFFAF